MAQRSFSKFDIDVKEWINVDSINLSDVNLVLVFQVNCPGCFIHALPMLNEIYKTFISDEKKKDAEKSTFQVFAISTAFEDFEYNTLQNTKDLIKTQKVVGETAKLYKTGKCPYALEPFPIGFDNMMAIEKYTNQVSKELPRFVPSTFLRNRLQGTPSWIMFDKERNILAKWFGHADKSKVMDMIRQAL